MADTTENRVLGALLGMAIGDALGAPVSGLDRAEIVKRFGIVDRYLSASGGETEIHPGEFTDETEVALCIVEALTANHARFDAESAGVRLLHLASGPSRHWMRDDTLRALDVASDTLEFSVPIVEDGPATGDVASRGVPVGLLHAVGRFDPAALRADAEAVTRLTHGSPAAFNATAAVAYGIRLAATGVPREQWAQKTAEFLGGGELSEALNRVDALLGSGALSETFDALGTGLAAAQSVPAAFASAMTEPDFEKAVFAAVNAGGATDTIGALAGALAGAAGGASDIPQELIDGLEGRIYVSLAAPWFLKAAKLRAGLLIDLRPIHPPRPNLPPSY